MPTIMNSDNRRTGNHPPGHDRVFSVSLFLFAFLLIFAITGCTLFKEETELSAEENYQRGMVKFEKEKSPAAIPYFQKILENYPFSIYAVPAELKIAESYFYNEKYVEALVHLQIDPR